MSLDAYTLAIWLLRIAFLCCLYLFLLAVARLMWRDLRSAAAAVPGELGCLVVVGAPEGGPPVGATFPLDAITTLGRDVNNAVVVDDIFVSAEHAVLTFRGRTWYVEDRASANGTYVNGQPIAGVAPLGFGDEVQIGQVRLRLDRPRQARKG